MAEHANDLDSSWRRKGVIFGAFGALEQVAAASAELDEVEDGCWSATLSRLPTLCLMRLRATYERAHVNR